MPKDNGVVTTWKLLALLTQGPKRVGELAEGMGVEERAVQRHLAHLRETQAPLEEERDAGDTRVVRYRLSPKLVVQALMQPVTPATK